MKQLLLRIGVGIFLIIGTWWMSWWFLLVGIVCAVCYFPLYFEGVIIWFLWMSVYTTPLIELHIVYSMIPLLFLGVRIFVINNMRKSM